jgi:hypothetical protein
MPKAVKVAILGLAAGLVGWAQTQAGALEPGTGGNLDLSAGTPLFQLANGTVVYSLKTRTSVKLLSGDKTMTPSALTGSYSRSGQRPVGGAGTGSGGGFWTPAHTILVAGSQVSPTR